MIELLFFQSATGLRRLRNAAAWLQLQPAPSSTSTTNFLSRPSLPTSPFDCQPSTHYLFCRPGRPRYYIIACGTSPTRTNNSLSRQSGLLLLLLDRLILQPMPIDISQAFVPHQLASTWLSVASGAVNPPPDRFTVSFLFTAADQPQLLLYSAVFCPASAGM